MQLTASEKSLAVNFTYERSKMKHTAKKEVLHKE